ncbi:NifU-like protein 4 [Ranunculus cassubicifolius]
MRRSLMRLVARSLNQTHKSSTTILLHRLYSTNQFHNNTFPYLNSSPRSSNFIKSAGQKRSMFIQTEPTPNPSSLMFYPGKPVMEVGSADFPNARTAMNSPLAKSLFAIDGTSRVFFGSNFITITKSDESAWEFLKPEVFAAIMDFYSSGQPLFLDPNVASSMDTAIHEDDSETVAMIKELLETRIRPTVQDDGGDIEYRGFDPESGVVKLKMQGACSGCPSSAVTLKSGIENMLMHYVPERDVSTRRENYFKDSLDEKENK